MSAMSVTESELNGVKGDKTSDLSYFHSVGKDPLIYRTVGQQLGIVGKEIGGCEAFVFLEEGRRITFGELLREADRLAAGFQCLNLKKGDRVAILALNVSTWPITMFAAARAGLIAVHLNPSYSPQEIGECLTKVSAKVLVAPESLGQNVYYEKLLEIIPELKNSTSGIVQSKTFPFLTAVIIDSDKCFTGTRRLCDVMTLPTNTQLQNIEDYQDKISPDCGCYILFTSGFTGKPKAVLLSHFGLINTGYNMKMYCIDKSILCMTVPFSHISGSGFLTIGCLCRRATIVIPSIVSNPEKILYAISNEKCNFLAEYPSFLMAMICKQKELKVSIGDINILFGGAHCSPKVFQEMKKELNLKKLMMCFGMTENTGLTFTPLSDDPDTLVLESVGRVLNHLEAKVINSQGNLVPFGQPGELCIRGYANMIGYWDDEEKTRKILDNDGWLRTGDCFILQPNGYGKIVGRIDEMISKGKEMIFPREIENFIVTCPRIAEVYVVGVPDEQWGEELCAFIRLTEGCGEFTSKDLHDFCQGTIQSSHIPRYCQIVKDFPRTMAGKVKKIELKQQFCKQ